MGVSQSSHSSSLIISSSSFRHLPRSLSLSLYAGNCRLSRISSRGNINYLSASIFLPNSYLKGKQKRAEVREIFFKLFISSSPSATVFSSCRMLCTARTANKGICHAFKNKGETMKRGNNQIFETLLIYSDTLYVLLSFVLSTCLKRTGLCVCIFPFPALGVIKGHECIIFQGLYWLIFELFFYVVCIIDSHHLSHLEQRRILGSSVHLPSESEIILYENALNSLFSCTLFPYFCFFPLYSHSEAASRIRPGRCMERDIS